jgi:hypothetical protein
MAGSEILPIQLNVDWYTQFQVSTPNSERENMRTYENGYLLCHFLKSPRKYLCFVHLNTD